MADQTRNVAQENLALLDQQRDDFIAQAQAQGAVPPTAGGPSQLVNLFTRGKRQREGAQIAQAQGAAALGASGVRQADIDPERLAGIQAQLANPATRAAGIAELDQISIAQGINASPTERKIQREALSQAQIKTQSEQLAFDQATGKAVDRDLLVSTATQLRGERAKDLAPFVDSLRSFDELQSALKLDSGPASMAVLFKFIKALDDSVVRSSEGELLTSSSGPVRRLVDMFNQVQAGGLFGPDTKQDINEVATAIAQSQFSTAQRINAGHDRVAARFGERFGMPSVTELSQSARFDPERQFTAAPGGSSDEPTQPAVAPNLLPPGVTAVP